MKSVTGTKVVYSKAREAVRPKLEAEDTALEEQSKQMGIEKPRHNPHEETGGKAASLKLIQKQVQKPPFIQRGKLVKEGGVVGGGCQPRRWPGCV
jgi:hypothetical protein